MKKKHKLKHIFFYSLIFLCFEPCYCQNEFQSKNDSILSNGIYIQNLHATVQWGTRFDSLYNKFNEIGIHKVTTKGKHFTLALDSVNLFNVKVNIFFLGRERDMFHRKDNDSYKFCTLQASFNNSSYTKLKKFFEEFTQKPERAYGNNEHFYFMYFINNCNVQLGKSPAMHGNYLLIQWLGIFDK